MNPENKVVILSESKEIENMIEDIFKNNSNEKFKTISKLEELLLKETSFLIIDIDFSEKIHEIFNNKEFKKKFNDVNIVLTLKIEERNKIKEFSNYYIDYFLLKPIIKEELELILKNKNKYPSIENYEKIKKIIDNIPFSLAFRDINGILLYANKRILTLFGVKSEQIIGTNSNDLLGKVLINNHEVDEKEEDEYIIKTKSSMIFERKVNWLGEIKYFQVYKDPVKNTNGDIIGIISLIRDTTDEHKLSEQIKTLAYEDTLTHLKNRRYLYKYLKECIDKNVMLTVMFLDLDNFKRLNDYYGHIYGDEALKEVSKNLQLICNNSLIARIGGDEFVIALENVKEISEVEDIANEILTKVKKDFGNSVKNSILSTSIGIIREVDVKETVENLFLKADFVLYKAKEKGKNQYVIYNQEFERERLFKFGIENDLKNAIKNNEITLYYQPQINSDGKVKGFEALFRWDNEKYKTIPVNDIINILEEINLIEDVGNCILEKAFEFTNKINKNVDNRYTMSINISVIQIMSGEFVDIVINLIEKTGVDPTLIIFEITESVMFENLEENIKKVLKLKELGIIVSLDDFGTGYSSLNYLVKLPISEVKIDRSFINRMNEGKDHITLVNQIVDIAHNFNLQVVAEGVETEEEFGILQGIGIDFTQGYLFSKPIPGKEAKKFLKER